MSKVFLSFLSIMLLLPCLESLLNATSAQSPPPLPKNSDARRVLRAGNRGHGWACNLKLNFLRRVRHMSEGCTIGKYEENKNLNHPKSFHEDE